MNRCTRLIASALLTLAALTAAASDTTQSIAEPALEVRVQRIVSELRCLVCQNQSVAESNAPLAEDLREQVRRMLREGQGDEQVRRYMTDRYGDFVLYRPPVRGATLLLWFGPAVLMLGGLMTLILVVRRHARIPDELSESDELEADEARRKEVLP